MREIWTFLGEARRHFHDVGAVLPSSRYLSAAMSRSISAPTRAPGAALDILEVGPGTGAVTRQIVRRLEHVDRLTLVEAQPAFAQSLKRWLATAENAAIRGQVTVVNDRVEALEARTAFDVIISSLPLNNFTGGQVEAILRLYASMLKPDGRLSFFEYLAIRRFRAVLAAEAEKQRLDQVGRIIGRVCQRFEFARDIVWLNVPPACVHHLCRMQPFDAS